MAFEQDDVAHLHPQIGQDTAQPGEPALSSPPSPPSPPIPPKVASRVHEYDVNSTEVTAPTAADVPLSSSSPGRAVPGAGSPAQPGQPSPPLPPMFNTPEGKIASYRRQIRDELNPQRRANYEALIRYYEQGGKVPEGQEELWAFEGRVIFDQMGFKTIDQLPEGWFRNPKVCDTTKFKQVNYVPGPDAYLVADEHGRVIL